jgi:lipid A disaccharide synthetase
MVVVYRASAILWHLLARWIVKTPSIALVNILAEKGGLSKGRIVPEVVPWYGSNAPVAELAIEILMSRPKREEQRDDLLKLVATLDRRGASKNAAKIAVGMMEASTSAQQ